MYHLQDKFNSSSTKIKGADHMQQFIDECNLMELQTPGPHFI